MIGVHLAAHYIDISNFFRGIALRLMVAPLHNATTAIFQSMYGASRSTRGQ